jgi:biopolymer transport protein ExbD
MKFRKRTEPVVFGFQIAPMVDILLVLLCFFIVTWSFARKELELDVKVPNAQNARETHAVVNQTIINVKKDGDVVWNRKKVEAPELTERLRGLATMYPDYAIIVRADEGAAFRHVARVLDICRDANIWNVAFATANLE